MSRYRRAQVPGATYFFTVKLLDRRSDLLVRHINLLRETVRATRSRHPFQVMRADAWKRLRRFPPYVLESLIERRKRCA